MSLVDKWKLHAQKTTTSPLLLEKLVRKSQKVARMVAANPASNDYILAKITRIYPYDRDLKAAIASHPNTPPDLLLNLSSEYPIQVFNNPSFRGNNNLIFKVSKNVLERMLMQPYVCKSFLTTLLSHPTTDVVISADLRLKLNDLNTQNHLKIHLEHLDELAYQGFNLPYLFALNELTPADLLEQIASHSDPKVSKALAANPNVSPEIIERLVVQFPDEVLKNPSIDLLIILNPYLLRSIPTKKIEIILQQPNVPESLLAYYTNLTDNDLRTAAKFHINLVKEELDNWQELAKEAIKNTTLPWHKIVSVSFIKELWKDYPELLLNNSEFRQSLALDFELDAKLALFLAEDSIDEVRLSLSRNPNIPTIVLDKLAGDRSLEVRLNVAKNPHTAKEILEDFVTNPDDRFMKAVASNPNAPIPILKWLANYKNFKVREIVANNPSTPKSCLARLANDEYASVYHAVFTNPVIPRKWLVKAFFKRRHDGTIRHALAKNHQTPLEILKILCYDFNQLTAYEVLRNPNLSSDFIGKIFDKNLPDYFIEAVTSNPKTPPEIIQNIINDLYQCGCLGDLGYSPYQNIHKTFPVLFENAMEAYNYQFRPLADKINNSEYMLKKLVATPKPSADRLAIFLSNHATPSILTDNYTSPSWLERYAIARNLQTPDVILERLSQDANAIVRAATKANQNARK
jgi:hypothetical protein